MALPVREQVKYWALVSAALLLVLYVLGNVILPYVLGMAVAYVMDPLADRLERAGLGRVWAVLVISVLAALVFVAAVLLVVPTLVKQITELSQALPGLIDQGQAWLYARFPSVLDESSQIRQAMEEAVAFLQGKGTELASRVFSSAMSLVNVVFVILIVPVVSFYLLLDWDRMIAKIDGLLPRDHAPTVRRLAGEIDRTLSGFIRGQGTVCLILGIYYAVALMAVGLNFGLVVGLIAGFLTFIPYVGAIVGGGLAIGLAIAQFWGEWWMIAVVYAIFQSGQMVEGNILTPKLVGNSVGLHPVWLIFALSAFASLFGFVGMVVAVPLAAVIGVLVRFLVEQYQNSRLYKGLDNNAHVNGDVDAG